MEALIQKQKTELRNLQAEKDALQAEYEKIKNQNQGLKDSLDKDPTKKEANARIPFIYVHCIILWLWV